VKNDELLPPKYRLENYHFSRVKNITKAVNEWIEENEKRYQATHGRKLRSDANRLESLAIILSGEQVKKCSPDEIWERAIGFKEWFEKKYKTTVRTMDWHRDEGSVNRFGQVSRNDHIHLEFDNVNTDGKMVRRLFSKGDLIRFQDQIAEIYRPLGFVRGEDTVKKNRHDTPKRGVGQKEWKRKKKAENLEKAEKQIAEDNNIIYAHIVERREWLATKEELKTEIKMLREMLRENGAKRPEHAQLEQAHRTLISEIEEKNLTISDMHRTISGMKKEIEDGAEDAEKVIYLGRKSRKYEELSESYLQSLKKAYAREKIAENQVKMFQESDIALRRQLNRWEIEINAYEGKIEALSSELKSKDAENQKLRAENEELRDVFLHLEWEKEQQQNMEETAEIEEESIDYFSGGLKP
jgi:hypothetical protein